MKFATYYDYVTVDKCYLLPWRLMVIVWRILLPSKETAVDIDRVCTIKSMLEIETGKSARKNFI
jgi:hypothetical protein